MKWFCFYLVVSFKLFSVIRRPMFLDDGIGPILSIV
jgi:hypothetical protein